MTAWQPVVYVLGSVSVVVLVGVQLDVHPDVVWLAVVVTGVLAGHVAIERWLDAPGGL
jgi:hypothetical protein